MNNTTDNEKSTLSETVKEQTKATDKNLRESVTVVNPLPLGIYLTLLIFVATAFTGYNNHKTHQKIKQEISQIEQNLEQTPVATVDALVGYQENIQAERAEVQARALRQQQGLAVDEDIQNIKEGNALQVNLTNEHATIGPQDATIILMEFSDLNCSFCGRYHSETLPKILENYVDSGKLRYVYRDYVGVGGAMTHQAAAAARCVRESSSDITYMNFVKDIYAMTGRKNKESIVNLAMEHNITGIAFETCVSEERYAAAVQNDTTAGQEMGVQGTPSFLLGYLQKDGTIDGINLQGALPYDVFEKYLDGFLEDFQSKERTESLITQN